MSLLGLILAGLIIGLTAGIVGGLIFYLIIHPKTALKIKDKIAGVQLIKTISFKKAAIILGIILVLGTSIYFLLSKRLKRYSSAKSEKRLIKTLDQYPIHMLRGGAVAVYREMKVYEDSMEKHIVINNLSDQDQKSVKVYEVIPKEVAKNASDIKFNIQPKIISADPIVLWDTGDHPRRSRVPVKLDYGWSINTKTSEQVSRYAQLVANPEETCTRIYGQYSKKPSEDCGYQYGGVAKEVSNFFKSVLGDPETIKYEQCLKKITDNNRNIEKCRATIAVANAEKLQNIEDWQKNARSLVEQIQEVRQGMTDKEKEKFAAKVQTDWEEKIKTVETAELKAIERTKTFQKIRDEVSSVVNPGTPEYTKIQTEAKKVITQSASSSVTSISQTSPMTTTMPTVKKSISAKTSPSPTGKSQAKPINFVAGNFPSTLLGLSLTSTDSTSPQDICWTKFSPMAVLNAVYGSGKAMMPVSVTDYGDESKIVDLVPNQVSCLNDYSRDKSDVQKKGSVMGYPFWLATTKLTISGNTITSAYAVVGKYIFQTVIVSSTGVKETDSTKAIISLIESFQK